MFRLILGVLVALGITGTAQPTLFGSSVSSQSNLAQKTTQFGHMPVVRVFYGSPPSNAWTTGLAAANHSAVIVSFNLAPPMVIAGKDNTVLEHFFDTAPTDHPIYYSYIHEPEVEIAKGNFTASEYRAAWVHVIALASLAHNPELHSTLILMAWDVNKYSHRNWRDYLAPGISTIGWDNYPPGGVGTPSPASFMGPAIAVAKAAGMSFGFSEFGTTTVKGRAAWLTAIGAYLRSKGALFGTVFDSTQAGGLGGGGSFVLTDKASIGAWRAVVQG